MSLAGHPRHSDRASDIAETINEVKERLVCVIGNLVYAAGRLGIGYDLLPWKVADLRDAIAKCYFGARELLPDDGVLLRSGLKQLRRYLIELPHWSGKLNSLVAFREDGTLQSRCFIKRDQFNEVFRSAEQRELVIKWLISKRRITLAKSDSDKPLVKEQHFWPDGKRYRSVEILWPVAKLTLSN